MSIFELALITAFKFREKVFFFFGMIQQCGWGNLNLGIIPP